MAKLLLLNWIMLSQQNFDYDSNFVYLRNLIRGMESVGEVLFLVTLPKGGRMVDVDFLKSEYVIPLSIGFPEGKRMQNVWFDSTLFRRIVEKFCCGAVYSNVPELVAQMKAVTRNLKDSIAVFTINHWVIHETLGFYDNLCDLRDLQVVGIKGADLVIWNSSYAKKMFYDEARKFGLGDDFINEVEKKSTILGMPIVDEMLKNIRMKKTEKTTFVYNHRTEYYKNTDVTFSVFDGLRREGYEFIVKFSMTGGGKYGKYVEIEYVRPFFKPKREEYLNEIAVDGINTFNSSHETFCIAMVESAYLGCIPVVPRGLTFEEIFGEDYPFMFSSVEEQKKILRRIMNGELKEEVEYWRKELRKRIEKKYDVETYARRLYEIFDNFMENKRERMWDALGATGRKFVLNFIEKNDGCEFLASDLIEEIRADEYGRQVLPAWLINTLLYGYVDWKKEENDVVGIVNADGKIA